MPTFFDKLTCIFRGHSYNQWVNFRGETVGNAQHCTEDMCCYHEKCTRCGRLSEILIRTPRHDYGDFEPSNEACTLIRSCKTCGFVQKSKQHKNFNRVKSEGSCEYVRVCENCGSKDDQTGMEHSFGDWFLEENACKGIRTCSRCGFSEEKVEHSGEWITIESTTTRSDGTEQWIYQQRTCKICGKTERKEYLYESPWA